MRVRGALHVHSTLSRDGTMTIAELASFFKQKGYHFLAMGEHAEDMDQTKIAALKQETAAHTNDEFCVIAGIEFAVTGQIHVVAIGVANLIRLASPVYVAQQVREQGGFSILAHPKRAGWDCPAEALRVLDAAEIWNIGYDGKYLPSAKALPAFARMRGINPNLRAIASHDFHRRASFYDVATEMDVTGLSRDPIIENLKCGAYTVRSRFFNCESDGRTSAAGAALVRHVSGQLEKMRKARSSFARRTA